MQKGINYFTFLCSDISGSPVTAITSGGFTLYGNFNATNITSFDYSIAEETNGYYTLGLDIDVVGQGYFGITHATEDVTPTFWDVTLENNDADSLYTLFLSLQQEGTVDEVANFVSVNTNPFKESDDITLEYIVSTQVTPDLIGWTNFKAELRNDLSLTSATSASYLGLADITIVDASLNSVSIDISGALTTGVVAEGDTNTTLYMDLQGYNPSGKKKTLIEFSIPIVREITYN
jgi:hypothetical protein